MQRSSCAPVAAPCCLLLLLPLLAGAGPAQDEASSPEAQVRALLDQGAAEEEAGDLEAASGSLREALNLAVEHDVLVGPASLQLGKLLYWNVDTGEGLALLYQAVQRDPGSLEAALALVDALLDEYDNLLEQGQPVSAESSLQRAADVLDPWWRERPDDPDVQLRRARVLHRTRGSEAEAVELLKGLVLARPDDAGLHQDLVQAVTAAKRFDWALEFYEDLEMERSLAFWFRSQVYVARAHYNYNRYLDDELAVSDYLSAERCVLESARLDPRYFEAASEAASYDRAWAGWTLMRMDRPEDAWKEFQAALGRVPGNTSAIEGLSNLGFRFNQDGDLESAREVYRQACLWAPERHDFWNNYGLLCRDTGLYEESFVAYRRALALSPDDPRTLNDCALILQYHLHRDLDLAEEWLLRARELARESWRSASDQATIDDQLVVYGDTLVNLWRLYDARGDMERASEMVNELREVDPTREELPPLPGGSSHGG